MTSYADLPRYSRDGDQFHYLWAARRCLGLLDSKSKLVAVSIEGASEAENIVKKDDNVGEELIDVGEYYGSEDYHQADKISYYQLKHSSTQANEEWTASGLEKTIRGFALRYQAFVSANGSQPANGKFTFHFLTNRPISSDVLEAVEDLALGNSYRNPKECDKFIGYSGLTGSFLQGFYNSLRLEGNHGLYTEQRSLLQDECVSYLPGADSDAPNEIKELVTRKATSENKDTPAIRKTDVLKALKIDESYLFPAPCMIQEPQQLVERPIVNSILEKILQDSSPVSIVHSIGGVGKSVLALQFTKYLPAYSEAIVYDCFGNGEYRNPSKARHRYNEALVQIANELASRKLCHPLVPNSHASEKDYLKAFISRLKQCVQCIRLKNQQAYILIVIDAADNAEMAAEDFSENRSFVKNLIRESIPEGVKITFLCRSYRIDRLNPPANIPQIELPSFSFEETRMFVQNHHQNVESNDVAEFHHLSSGNPRVQNNALTQHQSFVDALRSFGPNPIDTEDLIKRQLDNSIQQLLDQEGISERAITNSICDSLAVLRPFIPLRVLATLSKTNESAIQSFAVIFGRSIRVTDNSLYFVDEPTESWFRDKFRPTGEALSKYIQALTPLANTDAYAAGSLPFLLLEARKYDELVAYALKSDFHDELNVATRKDINRQKLQFALKACLRSKRYLDAAKLSFSAGIESAGNARTIELIQSNTDLAAIALGIDHIQGIIYRRELCDTWHGSHYAYESGLFSQFQELDALSRRRLARDWLRARLDEKTPEGGFESQTNEIRADYVSELAWATYCIEGAKDCALELIRWSPKTFVYQVTRHLSRRFIDHGKFDDLLRISEYAEHHPAIVLAIAIELQSINRILPYEFIARTMMVLERASFKLPDVGQYPNEDETLSAIVAIVITAVSSCKYSSATLSFILDKYTSNISISRLSSRYNPSKTIVMQAISLAISLKGGNLALVDFADDEMKEALSSGRHDYNGKVSNFRSNVESILPLYQLWVDCILENAQNNEIDQRLTDVKKKFSASTRYSFDEKRGLLVEFTEMYSQIIFTSPFEKGRFNDFNLWLKEQKGYFPQTLVFLARVAARTTGFESESFNYAAQAEETINIKGDSAESVVSLYVEIARSILAMSRSDSKAYFNKALEYSNQIGEEHLSRWSSILSLAEKASACGNKSPELSYKLARCGELIYKYVARDKYFPWENTIHSLLNIDPSSAVAIFSRWRDRNFGRDEKILSIAIHHLLERGNISAKIACAMTGIQAEWNYATIFKTLLDSKSDEKDASNYIEAYLRDLQLVYFDHKAWGLIRSQLNDANIRYPGIDAIVDFAKKKSRAEAYSAENTVPLQTKHVEESWDPVFDGIDLSNDRDVRMAYKRFLEKDFPRYSEKFFAESFRRIQLGIESEFIQSLTSIAEFDIYLLRNLLSEIPDTWKKRPGIQLSIKDLVRLVIGRCSNSIARNSYYEEVLFNPAFDCCGITENELTETALRALSEFSVDFDSERLFTLNSLLGPMLTPAEAKIALEFCLNTFESQLEITDGDGPWKESLSPASCINEAIAGYIWSGLASPITSVRWEYAHVLVNLCKYNLSELFELVAQKAKARISVGFSHEPFHFYSWHATQWFLIALARISKENPFFVRHHKDFLMSFFTDDVQPHVICQEYAKRAMEVIYQAYPTDFSEDDLALIRNTNKSPFIPTTEEKPIRNIIGEEKSETHFHFGIDFGPYWLAPLGRIFGIGQTGIERMLDDLFVNEWQINHLADWKADQRRDANVYPREGNYHSHGSYPHVDDLHFYLFYHGMMIVAARLLKSRPLCNPYNEEDPFGDWLERHINTRKDGYWLSDRRDPLPLDWPTWKDDRNKKDWRWSVQKKDFDSVLGVDQDSIAVSGNWNYATGQQSERISIHSALVSPDRSFALLRALQTAENQFDYKVPGADDELEIDKDEYQFKGWLQSNNRDDGIDAQDPWSGGISNNTPTPSKEICGLMNLEHDSLSRVWTISGQSVLWAQTWSSGEAPSEHDEKREDGTRFIASRSFIAQLLNKTSMDLIIEVEISRDLTERRYHKEDSDDIGYVHPYTRIYLFRGDNEIYTL